MAQITDTFTTISSTDLKTATPQQATSNKSKAFSNAQIAKTYEDLVAVNSELINAKAQILELEQQIQNANKKEDDDKLINLGRTVQGLFAQVAELEAQKLALEALYDEELLEYEFSEEAKLAANKTLAVAYPASKAVSEAREDNTAIKLDINITHMGELLIATINLKGISPEKLQQDKMCLMQHAEIHNVEVFSNQAELEKHHHRLAKEGKKQVINIDGTFYAAHNFSHIAKGFHQISKNAKTHDMSESAARLSAVFEQAAQRIAAKQHHAQPAAPKFSV